MQSPVGKVPAVVEATFLTRGGKKDAQNPGGKGKETEKKKKVENPEKKGN